jgi:hypothetical protein
MHSQKVVTPAKAGAQVSHKFLIRLRRTGFRLSSFDPEALDGPE